jgi:hypothetical protein
MKLTELVPILQYGTTDSEIEIMLQSIVQFQLHIQENPDNTKRLHILPGEKLQLQLELKPKFITKKRDYTKLFKVLCSKHKESFEIWKQIFSKLEIHVSLETETPKATDFEVISDEAKQNLVYIPKNIEKKTMDSNSSERTYEVVETKNESIFFDLDIDIPYNFLGKAYLVLDCYLPSFQFEEFMLRTLSDSKNSLDKFENFIPYETSKLYLDFNLFLGTICKPILIMEALKISSKSKFLNKTAIVQVYFENLSENKLKISTIDLQTMSIGVKEISKENLNQIVTSNEKRNTGSMIKITPLVGKSLFNYILDKNCLPLELEPGEVSSLIFQIVQNHSKSEYEDEELKNPFSQFSSILTAQYEMNGLKSKLSNQHSVKWNFIKNTGFVISLDAPSTVSVNENFNVSLVIKNFTHKKCDLDVLIKLPPNSPLICKESHLNVGVLESNQIKILNLTYCSMRSGIYELFEIELTDNMSKKKYESLCSHKVYIQQNSEKSKGSTVEISTPKQEIIQEQIYEPLEEGQLLNETEEKITKKKPIIPAVRFHQRSQSSDIMSPFPSIFSKTSRKNSGKADVPSLATERGFKRKNLLSVKSSKDRIFSSTSSFQDEDLGTEGDEINKTENDGLLSDDEDFSGKDVSI